MKKIFLLFACFAVIAAPVLAFADASAPPAATDVITVPAVSPELGAVAAQDDAAHLAAVLLTAITSGNWALAVSVVLTLVVWLVRKYGRALPLVGERLGPWLDHPLVAWALPSVASTLGAVVTSLVAGHALSLGLIVSAVSTGLVANALFVGKKKLEEAREAGTAAAAAVNSKSAAISVLRGPQP